MVKNHDVYMKIEIETSISVHFSIVFIWIQSDYSYRKFFLVIKIMSKNYRKNETDFEGKRTKFIQVALTIEEREIIRKFAKENRENSSTFCRRVIFDFIRRKENPELFNQTNVNQIKTTLFGELIQTNQKILELQEETRDSLGFANNLRETSEAIQEAYERLKKKEIMRDLSKETEIIADLLKGHKSLTIYQINEMTNIDTNKIAYIITNSKIFKLNITTGRYSLR